MNRINDGDDEQDDPPWWMSDISVKWTAQRHPDLPVLEATGRILLRDGEYEGAEEPTIEAGTIAIVKPYLWAGMDPVLAMDDISADYEVLACAVLGDDDNRAFLDEFKDWFLDMFGVDAESDPIFIEDIDIKTEHRHPALVAQAVLEAAATFGATTSPIIGYGYELVSEEQRDELRQRGLWDWVGPLGAKPWRNVLVACRPQD
jgi:hypothetical protein